MADNIINSGTLKGKGYYDDDFSVKPVATANGVDMRGVIDFGDLYQFAPFESGYSFIAVINGPKMAQKIGGSFENMQKSFINIIENEFRGLDGIEDITSDTMEITDNISTLSLIGKVNQSTSSQITMRFFEKTGALITKYIATYLRYIRDPKTQAKTYGGTITYETDQFSYGIPLEVFNMLYVVTDSTCLHVEKAFLLLNAQPTSAGYSELYNTEKGQIETKEITVNWNCFVVDGAKVNEIAAVYMANLITNGELKINSYEMNWSISGLNDKEVDGKRTPAKLTSLSYKNGKLISNG